jgi:hypothetical protein
MTNRQKYTRAIKKAEGRVLTPWFRAAWPEIFKPSAMNEGDEPKYSVCMIFDPNEVDLSALEELIDAAIAAKWPNGAPKNMRLTLRDGDEKEIEAYDGMIFATARTKYKPGCVDFDRTEIIDSTELYPGCYCRATVSAYAYSHKGNNGVGLNLFNIQKLDDGETMATSRVNAEDDFHDDEDDGDF